VFCPEITPAGKDEASDGEPLELAGEAVGGIEPVWFPDGARRDVLSA